ncbi:NfeD family protein [Candidatus Dependentiae bacterium]|nr:NfeD family protein [Candidatus Dependentiae bacterium]
MESFTWWIVLLVGCTILELSSPGMFFFLSFSCGALAAAFYSFFYDNTTVEFSIFLVVTALSFFALRRYERSSKDTLYETNVYALHGRKGTVLEKISPLEKGWVTIEGQIWAAFPANQESIEKGSIILVVNSEGSHLVVKKIGDTV